MACERIALPDGGHAIVCGTRPKKARCVGCDAAADLLCDWKVPAKRTGTCDTPICAGCTHSPAPGKDLCPDHAAEWPQGQACV